MTPNTPVGLGRAPNTHAENSVLSELGTSSPLSIISQAPVELSPLPCGPPHLECFRMPLRLEGRERKPEISRRLQARFRLVSVRSQPLPHSNELRCSEMNGALFFPGCRVYTVALSLTEDWRDCFAKADLLSNEMSAAPCPWEYRRISCTIFCGIIPSQSYLTLSSVFGVRRCPKDLRLTRRAARPGPQCDQLECSHLEHARPLPRRPSHPGSAHPNQR